MLLHSFLQNEIIVSVIHVDLVLFKLVKYNMFMILYYVTVAALRKSLISCLCSPMSLNSTIPHSAAIATRLGR